MYNSVFKTVSFRRFSHIFAVVCTLSLLGCAEGGFLSSGPSGRTTAGQARGFYKVGTPYQIDGVWYYPREDYSYSEIGIASWYGPGFHNNTTANGERYDMNALTAAHRTLPLPSIVRVTNLENGRALILRINDRGPFANNRIIDISRRGAQLLGFKEKGTAKVKVEILPDESRALKQRVLDSENAAKSGRKVATKAAPAKPRTLTNYTPAVLQAPEPPASRIRAINSPPGVSQPATQPTTQNIPRLANKPPAEIVPDAMTAKPGYPQMLRPTGAASSPQTLNSGAAQGLPSASSPAPLSPLEARQTAIRVPVANTATSAAQSAATAAKDYFVQVGAFSNYDNAVRLSKSLTSIGNTAISPVVNAAGKTLYRVRLGPVAAQSDAKALLVKVKASGHIGSRIIKDATQGQLLNGLAR